MNRFAIFRVQFDVRITGGEIINVIFVLLFFFLYLICMCERDFSEFSKYQES